MQSVNFQTTNPAEFPDRLTELQIAVQLDEANNLPVAKYTAAGAIALGGKALLLAGSAAAMTLAQPVAGAQNAGGNDGMVMEITALDAYAYTVTTSADGINGTGDTLTASAAVGDTVNLVAYGGVWYIRKTTTGTPAWALTEV
jgi:hypothetical protein